MFDIGNYIELAEIALSESRPGDLRKQQYPFPENYSTETNIELYRKVLMPEHPSIEPTLQDAKLAPRRHVVA
jgi:hypothetical protein